MILYLFQNIQMNFLSAIIYWVAFSSSILISWIYQKERIYYDGNGELQVRSMAKILEISFLVFIVLIPSLLIGFRDFSVGSDTLNYVQQYHDAYNIIQPFTNINNILFVVLTHVTYLFTNGHSPTFFLFSVSFLTLFIFVLGLNKWLGKISLPFALFIYYIILGLTLVDQARQLLAVSIVFYAFTYLIKEDYPKYVILILISGLIHFTGLIGLIFPFLIFKNDSNIKLKQRVTVLIMILLPLLILPFIDILTIILPERYTYYFSNFSFEGLGLGWVITIVPVIIPLIFFSKYNKTEITQLLTLIVLLTIPFRLMGYFSFFISRLAHYTMSFLALLLPLIYRNTKERNKHKFAILFMIVLLILYFIIQYIGLNSAEYFPYILVSS